MAYLFTYLLEGGTGRREKQREESGTQDLVLEERGLERVGSVKGPRLQEGVLDESGSSLCFGSLLFD